MIRNLKSKNILTTAAFLALVLVFWMFYKSTNTPSLTPEIQNSNVTTNTSLQSALDKALLDEYKARATYESVISKFGQVRPFINIVQAENNHITSLNNLYVTYNLKQPIIPSTTPINFSSLQEACVIGMQAEIDNAKLYKEELLPQVNNYPDVATVFTQLMNASQQNHLPAFERCAGR
jgi:hypothetical protein